jgi:predicted ATPase with chaperone activity
MFENLQIDTRPSKLLLIAERVEAVLRNCGFSLPARHITTSLAPADV